MRIQLTSIYVDDQRAALAFYTDVLGFTVRHDIPLGEDSWLTVVSPDSPTDPSCSSSQHTTEQSHPTETHSTGTESPWRSSPSTTWTPSTNG